MEFVNSALFNTLIAIIFGSIGYWITLRIFKQGQSEKAIDDMVKQKIVNEEFGGALKRIGKQVDCHEVSIETINRALVFLVTKAGGNPREIGL